MKKLFITLICLSLGFVGAQAQNAAAAKDPNAPVFKFKTGETHDFGEIPEGPVAEYQFEFTNTGKEPLVIQNASASCGCTTPEWPKEPILPGKKGILTVKYNTSGRVGPFTKDVYIQSNAKSDKERYELHIKGTVKAKAPETPAAK
jgi:Protein of unknown function (DUF1573)